MSSAGSIAGALLYRWLLRGMKSASLLYLSIGIGATTALCFLAMTNEAVAVAVYFAAGIASMISLVASLTLAADYAPRRSEGFAFAALMSITNLASALGDNLGSFMYEHVFANRIAPLILVSAAATLVAVPFVPMLRLGDKRHGEAAASAVS